MYYRRKKKPKKKTVTEILMDLKLMSVNKQFSVITNT